MKPLLELRKSIKKKKPDFTRQDNHKKPKLGDRWRKPKGLQSKMRLHLRGYKRSPEVGWGSPKEVKGLTSEGLRPVHIMSLKDISSLKKETDAVIIASNIGKRKRLSLVQALLEKKIAIINIKDPSKYIEGIEKDLKQKKQAKQAKTKEKAEKKKEKEAKEKKAAKEAKEKEPKGSQEGLADKIDQDDRKKQEKQEKDKIITKKE